MREIKKLKHSEPHKFKRKANEDQYKFNLKLGKTLDNVKSAAQKSQLEKLKSELDEGEELLLERQKDILLADKSESGWFTVEEYKKHDLAENSDDEKRIFSAERRARATLSTLKKKRSSSFAAEQKIFACTPVGSLYFIGQLSTATPGHSVSCALFVYGSASQYGQLFCLR